MTRPFVPQDIVDLAHARREARARREWDRADELREQIEAGGWTVVDRGVDFDLRPLRRPDVVVAGTVRYGASESVPSRLLEPPTEAATIVLIVESEEEVEATVETLAGLGAGIAAIVVANGPGVAGDPALEALEVGGAEVVRLADRLGPAAARNAGLRRSVGAMVVLAAPGTSLSSAGAEALAAGLEDPATAIVGSIGLASVDIRRFSETSGREVAAVSGPSVSFRRDDYATRGPLDERFRSGRQLDIWWSLVLRDEGEGMTPRRALRVPVTTAGEPSSAIPRDAATAAATARSDKRDSYRILDRFGHRRDLAVPGDEPGPEPADRHATEPAEKRGLDAPEAHPGELEARLGR